LRKFQNVVYFAASCDSPEVNKRFAESLGVDYPILSDPGCKVARAYGVASPTRKFPQRWTFIIGPDGKILHIEKRVNARGHGQQVVQLLEKLGIKKKS